MAGNAKPRMVRMIAMTTSISIKVKAEQFFFLIEQQKCDREKILEQRKTGEAKSGERRQKLRLQFESDCREGRQLDDNRLLSSHPWLIFALHAAVISNIAAAVRFRVGIDDLAIRSRTRHTQPVIVPNDWGCVHDKHNRLALARFTQKGNDAVIGVMKINPFKPVITVVLLPTRRLAFVSVV